jgi:hypothetical protein
VADCRPPGERSHVDFAHGDPAHGHPEVQHCCTRTHMSADRAIAEHLNRGIVYRRKLNRAWETLRSMPMPAIASDRLAELHNDLAHYDTLVAQEMRDYLRGNSINRSRLIIDAELEETLRAFKAETPGEVECRREMLRYKRRVDDVVRELRRLNDERVVAK